MGGLIAKSDHPFQDNLRMDFAEEKQYNNKNITHKTIQYNNTTKCCLICGTISYWNQTTNWHDIASKYICQRMIIVILINFPINIFA